MTTDTENGSEIAERLLCAEAFPHQVTELELMETHISWVILTGRFAYKIKKPVVFDFVDYSTLSSRRHYCHQEVELNRRFAPEIYLGVVPIFERDGALFMGRDSDQESTSEIPVEFAVKMHQFSQYAIVAARLQNLELTCKSVEEFGVHLVKFHDSIQSNPPSKDCGRFDRVEKDAMENFPTLLDAFDNDDRFEKVKQLEFRTIFQLTKLEPKFGRRLSAGKIRQCHGDLHLKNIIQKDGRLIAFDGIEFNPQFQWIDVLSEIAFPVMDLVARGRVDLGWRLLNAYMESTDNYRDLDILRFYLVYRALVRAKVTWLNPANHTPEVQEKYADQDGDANGLAGPWDKYLATASYFAFELKPRLTITHGFSGSGKSTRALELIDSEGGVRIRSDAERHKLSREFATFDKYSEEMNDWVYVHLAEMARSAIGAGLPVVIDASFLKRSRRSLFENLAKELDVEFQILNCDAPFEELCHRIESRTSDPSDATVEVLRMQMETHEPLTTDELQFVRTLPE